MIIAATFSLLIGVAFASPLLISDLNIRPWITHVQGTTAEFKVEAIYANFTVLEDEPSVSYQVVLNITNLSDIGAKLRDVNFIAAGKITNTTGMSPFGSGNWSSGRGWEAEGAWVDGKWYNLTWVNGTYPYFDINGNMAPSPFPMPNMTGYWMEGVQVYERSVNGTVTGVYLNMNGTWTDVTGRITVADPGPGSGWLIDNNVVSELHVFQDMPHENDDTLSYTKYTQTGDGNFDNYWAPHESRLIMLQGVRGAELPWGTGEAIDALKTGTIMFKTQTFNTADYETPIVNNTIEDTWSYATELKQVQLTKLGNSYVYNSGLLANQMFQPDQWGIEIFVQPRD